PAPPPQCPDRRRSQRPKADIRRGAPIRPTHARKPLQSAPPHYPLSSRARTNASWIPICTGLAAEIMRPNRPDSVLYLMFPTANGPLPRDPCVVSSTPFAIASRPSIPDGGTALASAATRRPLAASSCVRVRTRTPARPQQATTSAAATTAAFLPSSLPSAACTSAPNRDLISPALSATRLMPS